MSSPINSVGRLQSDPQNNQACLILTTCSSRETEASSSSTSRASRTTGVSGECDTFHENNMTFDLVKALAKSIRTSRSSGETASL